MANEEFVILLGDAEEPKKEQPKNAQEEFVILLDQDQDASTEKQKPAAAASFSLPDSCTVAVVGDMYQELAERLEEGGEHIDVDCGQVVHFDTAFAQLLLAAARKAAAKGKSLNLREISPKMGEVLDRLDISRLLDVPGGGPLHGT